MTDNRLHRQFFTRASARHSRQGSRQHQDAGRQHDGIRQGHQQGLRGCDGWRQTVRRCAQAACLAAVRHGRHASSQPVGKGLAGGLSKLFDGLFAGGGDSSECRRAIPFATGGVIGAPTYFPLSHGGLGLAGEAGPEAIVPLTRGPDGRLGVAMSGAGQPTNVTVHIAAADAQSFRRSEAYVTGQIARAVARGQRGL